MKILTGSQIKGADTATIENEPVGSLELMERAAETIAQWICNNVDQDRPLLFVVGKGNNGGDGLAAARILYHAGFDCSVAALFQAREMSEESMYNMDRLPAGVPVVDEIGTVAENAVVIDAILGTGCRGELSPAIANAIRRINEIKSAARRNITVISIDIPSGMTTEFGNGGRTVVAADCTLTLQFPKLSMLLPEAGGNCGKIEVLDIGLDETYIDLQPSRYNYIKRDYIRSMVAPRPKFGHKGTFGHALLVCGSEGMAGAAILSAGGALRSGCGLVTIHLPGKERFALHANYPSAMASLDPGDVFTQLPVDIDKYSAIGVGCGLGQDMRTVAALQKLMHNCRKPMVLDADALNIIAANPDLMKDIPQDSILTPHPGELERIIGQWEGEEDKIEKVVAFAQEYGVSVVVKGAHTMICSQQGNIYFNSTGNPGMAKGGAGDVLTGLITGLVARGYDPCSAAILGVYIHGDAGDRGAAFYGVESMNSADLPEFIAEAMQEVE